MKARNVQNWLSDCVSAVRNQRTDGREAVWRPPYRKCLHQLDRVMDSGVSIYDREWDLLVVLDACRHDLFCAVAEDYDFVADVGSVRSLDSMTREWMARTFVQQRAREMAATYYLCANPYSDRQLDAADFAELDEIWRYGFDDDVGTVRPETVTDRCIRICREETPERVIAHYIQPHWPFVPAMELTKGSGLRPDEFGGDDTNDVWQRLQRGEVTAEAVREGYRDNLAYVLDSVAVLLENVDAERVVVTSDHGNAFGEYAIYGHPMHMPFGCLRTVPYVETTATDERTRDPEPVASDATGDVEDRLAALGYH